MKFSAGSKHKVITPNTLLGAMMLALLLGLVACQTSETSYGDLDPCTTNDDCKRNRVCIDGVCVYPNSLDGDSEDGDVNDDVDATEEVEQEGPDPSLICDSLCGYLNDCDLLSSSSPFGSTFDGCHMWCLNKAVTSAEVACVKSQSCDLAASEECLGMAPDGDVDEDGDIVDPDPEVDPCEYQGTVQAGSSEAGNTEDAANDADDASACGEFTFAGNDHLWKLVVAANTTVKVSLVGNGFDPALWILDSCNGACIAAADTDGTTESLLVNAGENELTLVVVVDAAGSGVGGQYLLGVSEVTD